MILVPYYASVRPLRLCTDIIQQVTVWTEKRDKEVSLEKKSNRLTKKRQFVYIVNIITEQKYCSR